MSYNVKKALLLLCFTWLAFACRLNAQVVTLDYYFNHEVHKNASGQVQRFHYLWNETDDNGYSTWGDAFKKLGATLDTLAQAPTAANLKNSAVYIIVDPDTKKENPTPNYISNTDAESIAAWVK